MHEYTQSKLWAIDVPEQMKATLKDIVDKSWVDELLYLVGALM